MLKTLNTFVELARQKKNKKIVIAVADDSHVLEAIKRVIKEKLAEPIFIGDRANILKIASDVSLDIKKYEIIDEPNHQQACQKAVELIRAGAADVLMKGLVNSSIYLRAILNSEKGLKKSKLVMQMAFIESPHYHKIFAYADSGINIAPNLNEKVAMLKQAVDVFHRLGIKQPKIGIISAVENINENIPSTVDAGSLTMMNRRGDIKGCLIDGPLSIDLAFSKEACEHKRLNTQVGGDVDLILLPEINSANVFYKTVCFLGGAKGASIMAGTIAPVVFPSRADSVETKFFAMACGIAQCD
jgi:phosphate butyryltransferase